MYNKMGYFVDIDFIFMSAVFIMASFCGVGRCIVIHVNIFSETTRPRDVLLILKDTLSIKDDKS